MSIFYWNFNKINNSTLIHSFPPLLILYGKGEMKEESGCIKVLLLLTVVH